MCFAANLSRAIRQAHSSFHRKSTAISIISVPIMCLVMFMSYLQDRKYDWYYGTFTFCWIYTCLWVKYHMNAYYLHIIYTFCWLCDVMPTVYRHIYIIFTHIYIYIYHKSQVHHYFPKMSLPVPCDSASIFSWIQGWSPCQAQRGDRR